MKKLSRDEMKNVIGGGEATQLKMALPTCNCNNPDDCAATNELCMSSCSGGTGAGHCGCP